MPLPGTPDYPPGLLDITMDQLRTLLAVYEEGTALGAARRLGREQSSIQKQLDTMNRKLGDHCGEPLLRKRGRGERVHFTRTGEELARLAQGTLDGWREGLDTARRRRGRSLRVGSTRYTLGYLLNAVEQVNDRFTREGVELTMAHVRSGTLLEKLRSHELDLVCGSILVSASAGAAETTAVAEQDARFAGYEVMEWRRGGFCLATNQPDGDLVQGSRSDGRGVGVRSLPRLPLVVSTDGLIPDVLRGWFGPEYRRRMRIAAEIDSAHYGFELLSSRVLYGSMLVTQGIGEAIAEGRLPEAQGLRTLPLVDDVGTSQRVLVGAFRRSEPENRDPDHPVSLLWEELARKHAHIRAEERASARNTSENAPEPAVASAS
ncbi:LysR family transcriptional regulator [Streptomyces smyrnaeus]|uniref:LysR family transcriptional regulator n=1 Tax=Streptomyces TaxID=1883 RepID=UPI000C683152|nr:MULTISPECIES: LysR family transcriptional regulator [unclassified Streptomyces]